MRVLWRLQRSAYTDRRGRLPMLVALQLASCVATLALPYLNARIIDRGIAAGDTGQLLVSVAAMVAAASLFAILLWLIGRQSNRISRSWSERMRARMFDAAIRLPAAQVRSIGAGALLTRSTSDVRQIETLVGSLSSSALSAPLLCVVAYVFALVQAGSLVWVLAAATVVVIAAVLAIQLGIVARYREMLLGIDLINRTLREQISGVRPIRAFRREAIERDRFRAGVDAVAKPNMRAGGLMTLMLPVTMLVTNMAVLGGLWFGALGVESGGLTLGAVVAFVGYLEAALGSLIGTASLASQLPNAVASAQRIDEVLAGSPGSGGSPAAGQPLTASSLQRSASFSKRARLSFHGVEVRHPGALRAVLSGVDFDVAPGSWTAVVGSTGSGKSTLLSVVPRLVSVSAGRVCLDGHDLGTQPLDAIRNQMSLVTQRPYLMAGTIADNLRIGRPDATEVQMWSALTVAAADEFVRQLPGQLEGWVGQGGVTLSGGQRQRVAIARAILRRVPLYLFDDCLAALDALTEADVRRALRAALPSDAAALIVSQRLATVQMADRVAVLDNGELVGFGTYAELLAGCDAFVEFVAAQDPGLVGQP